jgi:hypothetical protein
MHTITVISSSRGRVVETGEEFIDVAAEIRQDGETVAERRLGFPLETTADEVREELSKVLSAYVRDQELASQTQRSEELNTHADEVQQELEGVTLEYDPSS